MLTSQTAPRTLARAISLTLGITSLPVAALDYSWVGGSGDWDTASNWDQNAVPQWGDSAAIQFNDTVDRSITYNALTPEYLTLLTLDNAGHDVDLRFDLLGSWMDVDSFIVGSSGNATVVQSGATVTASNLVVGQYAGSVGDYQLSGGDLWVIDLRLGAEAGSEGTFTWTGGFLDGVNFHIGQSGSGTFIQDMGNNWWIQPHQSIVIGELAGSDGVYEQRSGDLNAWGSQIIVGGAGRGTYRQLSGIHEADETVIGHLAGGEGTYELGVDARHDTLRTVVGAAGTGHYVQTAGQHDTEELVIGESAGSDGTYDLQGGTLITGTTHIGNAEGATGAMVLYGPEANWINSGAIYVGTDSGPYPDPDCLPAPGAGLLQLQDGSWIHADTVIVGETGEVKGDGVIEADVTNGGLFAPGSSPGLLTIFGDYTQLVGGSLNIELGGHLAGIDQDYLEIYGNANLGGELNVSLFEDYDFTLGESFDILFALTVNGSFDSLLFPVFNGMTFDIAYDLSTVRLTVVNAVPVPAAAWLFGSGALALAGVARRRNAA